MSVTAVSTSLPLSDASLGPPEGRHALSVTMAGRALEALCRQIEDSCPGTYAAVHVLGQSARRWSCVIAPNLPEPWRRLHRVPTGPAAGACGAALTRGRRVVVTDVTTSPLYRSRQRAAAYASIGACWATPLLGSSGEVKGVLALCVARGGRPLRREARAMNHAAQLAALLIEHHEQERNVAAGHRRWREVVERAAVGIALVGAAGRFVMTNPAYRKLVGYTDAELCTRTSLELTHPDDREAAGREISAVLRGQRGEARSEKRYLRADGQTIWVRVTTSLSQGPGAPFRLELLEDISDRQRVEGELRRTRAYLADAERLGGTGTWIADVRTGLLLWSHEMFRIWGLDPDGRQPTLDTALAQVHAEDAARVRASFEEGLRSGKDIEGEHRLVRPDGTIAHVRYLGRPVLGRSGEPLEYVGTVRDITDERRVRQELQSALDDMRLLAARQVQARDDERRRIARHLHETTVQDLAALRLNLATLGRRSELQGTGARAVLEESIALADHAMADLRTLSYLLHPPLLDEAGLESALRWYAAGFAKRSGVDVRLDLPPELGRLPQEVETTVFRSVQECLLNIHRHAGSLAAAIRIRLEDGRLVTEVQDWGRGMPATAGPRSCDGRTFGVGIAGMRERIQQLGGTLEIESGGAGTTVRAVLPVGSAA